MSVEREVRDAISEYGKNKEIQGGETLEDYNKRRSKEYSKIIKADRKSVV